MSGSTGVFDRGSFAGGLRDRRYQELTSIRKFDFDKGFDAGWEEAVTRYISEHKPIKD